MTASSGVETKSRSYYTEGIHPAIWFVVVAVVYFFFTKVGLYFVAQPEGLSIFWPASGIALAALIVNPRRTDVAIVAIFLANIAGNFIGGNSFSLSIGFALVNTSESLACYLLIKKFFPEKITFGKQSIVIGFVFVSISAVAGIAVVGAMMLHLIHGAFLFASWYIWLVSDALGIIMVTPVVVSWLETERREPQASSLKKDTEAFLISLLVVLITWLLYPGEPSQADDLLFHRFAVYPLIVLVAVRHGRKWTFLSLLFYSVSTVWLSMSTGSHIGVEDVSVKMYFLDIQMFLIIANATILILSSVAHERRVASTRIKKSEQRQKLIYTKTPVMMFSTDKDGTILSVSEQWLEIMGYAENNVVGEKMEQFLSADSRTLALGKYFPQLMNSGHVRNFPFSFVKKNGEVVYTILSSMAERDYSGNIQQVMSVIVDITEKRLTEEELILSESRFRHLFSSMSAGFALHEIIVDKSGKPVDYRFLEVNPAFEKLTGLDAEKLIGKTVLEVMPGTEKYWIEKYGHVALTGESLQFEDFSAEIGKYYEVTAYSPIKNHFAVVFNDVTANREAEKERELLRSQLMQSQKMEAIGSLAGGVAHEFNNMLGIIMGSAQLAMSDVDKDSEIYKELQVLLSTSGRASGLTKKLLTFARFDRPEAHPVAVKDIISEVFALLQRTILKDIRIDVNVEDDAGVVSVDRNQIYQVLINLCNNAADAMPEGGVLTISAGKYEERADNSEGETLQRNCLIQVRDTGTGIEQQYLERVFDPFFTTKEIGKGTGLGLSVSHGIIMAHGGSITIDSETGKGTVVNIKIPNISEISDETKESHHNQAPEKGKTILIIDDERLLLSVTKRLLEKYGYNVLICSSGTEALTLFREKKKDIDIVVLDLILPGEKADVIFNSLKEEDQNVKVLIASGYSEDGLVDLLKSKGAGGFLPKPYEVEQLCEKIEEILDQ